MIIELEITPSNAERRITRHRHNLDIFDSVIKDLHQRGFEFLVSGRVWKIWVNSNRPVDATMFALKYPGVDVRMVKYTWADIQASDELMNTEFGHIYIGDPKDTDDDN